jgi:hypothetical protein
VWFALAALMVLPRPLTSVLRATPPPLDLNRLCGRLGIGAVVCLVGVVLLKGVSGYPAAAAAAATSAAPGTSDVYASELYGDWLLTVAPELRGRIAFDSRIELLSREEVVRIQLAQDAGLGWQEFARQYPVFVLNTTDQRNLVANLSRAGYQTRYRRDSLVVLSRS